MIHKVLQFIKINELHPLEICVYFHYLPNYSPTLALMHDKPCIQTGSRLRGTVWRGLIFFTTDRPDYHRMPPPAGDNHGWVVFAVRTGFALGHRASTFRACAHLITTAVRYQLRAQGRFSSPEPNMFGGDAGKSPGERPHDVIAGGKSRLAGLSPLSGTPSERGERKRGPGLMKYQQT